MYHTLLVPIIHLGVNTNWLKGRTYFKVRNLVSLLDVNKEAQYSSCCWLQAPELQKNESEDEVYIPKTAEKRDGKNSAS